MAATIKWNCKRYICSESLGYDFSLANSVISLVIKSSKYQNSPQPYKIWKTHPLLSYFNLPINFISHFTHPNKLHSVKLPTSIYSFAHPSCGWSTKQNMANHPSSPFLSAITTRQNYSTTLHRIVQNQSQRDRIRFVSYGHAIESQLHTRSISVFQPASL